jgi:hypothetical protein
LRLEARFQISPAGDEWTRWDELFRLPPAADSCEKLISGRTAQDICFDPEALMSALNGRGEFLDTPSSIIVSSGRRRLTIISVHR